MSEIKMASIPSREDEEAIPEQRRRETGTPQLKQKTHDLDKPLNRNKRVIFTLTTIQFQKLRKEAYERNVTVASILRESIEAHFTIGLKKNNPDQTETIQEIEECIAEATSGFFQTFNMENFLVCLQENEIVGDVWNKELIETYLEPRIREASKGLLSDNLEDVTNDVMQLLQFTDDNASFLCKQLGLIYSKEEAEAETKEDKEGFFAGLK